MESSDCSFLEVDQGIKVIFQLYKSTILILSGCQCDFSTRRHSQSNFFFKNNVIVMLRGEGPVMTLRLCIQVVQLKPGAMGSFTLLGHTLYLLLCG